MKYYVVVNKKTYFSYDDFSVPDSWYAFPIQDGKEDIVKECLVPETFKKEGCWDHESVSVAVMDQTFVDGLRTFNNCLSVKDYWMIANALSGNLGVKVSAYVDIENPVK